jgi:hypothetical protein
MYTNAQPMLGLNWAPAKTTITNVTNEETAPHSAPPNAPAHPRTMRKCRGRSDLRLPLSSNVDIFFPRGMVSLIFRTEMPDGALSEAPGTRTWRSVTLRGILRSVTLSSIVINVSHRIVAGMPLTFLDPLVHRICLELSGHRPLSVLLAGAAAVAAPDIVTLIRRHFHGRHHTPNPVPGTC